MLGALDRAWRACQPQPVRRRAITWPTQRRREGNRLDGNEFTDLMGVGVLSAGCGSDRLTHGDAGRRRNCSGATDVTRTWCGARHKNCVANIKVAATCAANRTTPDGSSPRACANAKSICQTRPRLDHASPCRCAPTCLAGPTRAVSRANTEVPPPTHPPTQRRGVP